MEEKRQEKRTLMSLFIRFEIEDGTTKYESFTEDVSTQGMRLLTSSRPNLNDNLNMSIDVPNNPDMTMAEGRVCWVGQRATKDDIGRQLYPVGVEITYIEREDKMFLLEYLNRHRAQ